MPKKSEVKTEAKSIKESLKKLEEIAAWFENDSEFDLDEGLKKIKEGAGLVASLKKELTNVENEFREIQKELEQDS